MVRSGRIAPAAEAQRVVGTAKHTGEVAISALVDVSGVAGTAPLLSEPIATICRARGSSFVPAQILQYEFTELGPPHDVDVIVSAELPSCPEVQQTRGEVVA